MVRFLFPVCALASLFGTIGAMPAEGDIVATNADVKKDLECGLKSMKFSDYRGSINTTISGRTCQRWDQQAPHRHSRTKERYPDSGLDENYCRNPNGASRQAWCYTTDPQKRWDYCAIPDCDATPGNLECGLKSTKQAEYRGSINKTRSGKTCQPWDDQAPHTHSYTSGKYPDAGLNGNFCRNPKPGAKAVEPWCYTNDPDSRWEYCDVPKCLPDPDDTSPPTYETCGTTWNEDGSFVGNSDYRGTVAKTVSGRECQRWDQQSPHKHSRTYEKYPYSGLEQNYCRNPDGEGSPWCYTKDPQKRWEYCDIPKCDNGPPTAPSFCYDYSSLQIDLSPKECTASKVQSLIKEVYNQQRIESNNGKCKGGFERELMALTRTTSYDDAYSSLSSMCSDALQQASDEADNNGWEMLENEGSIDLDKFFDGKGFLNDETGNFQQEADDFIKRGGKEKFIYIGDDPRLNDYLSTTEQSYKAGKEIYNVFENEATSSFLSSPTSNFSADSCPGTNAAVCCWSRDRQYFDNNGNCNSNDCANQNPGDNTDLCWTSTKDGEIFPYPNDDVEQDLHCHGFAWAHDDLALGDINTKARWNNLFFVSMYDHLYQRGYVDAITDDPLIAGEQAMCGCVEDTNPIARADCTEVIGRTNYTITQDGNNGPLVIHHIPDTFFLEFRACQGYDYVEGFTPEDYANPSNSADLEASDNDLAAFVFRLYLEGKIDDQHVNNFEQTIIGYRDPSVNDGDAEREVACKAAFKAKYPDTEWKEREIVGEEAVL